MLSSLLGMDLLRVDLWWLLLISQVTGREGSFATEQEDWLPFGHTPLRGSCDCLYNQRVDFFSGPSILDNVASVPAAVGLEPSAAVCPVRGAGSDM